MKIKTIALLGVACVLAGCATVSTIKEYQSQKLEKVKIKGTTYSVTPHPTELKLLIGGSIGQAVQKGLMLGGRVVPEIYFKQAEQSYLKQQGKGCVIDDYYEIGDVTYEAVYSCD